MEKERIQTSRLSLYSIVVAILVTGAFLWFASDRDELSVLLDGGQKENIVVSTTTLALIKHNKQVLELNAGTLSLIKATKNWHEYKDREVGFSIKYPADLVAMRYGEHYPLGVDEVKNEEGL